MGLLAVIVKFGITFVIDTHLAGLILKIYVSKEVLKVMTELFGKDGNLRYTLPPSCPQVGKRNQQYYEEAEVNLVNSWNSVTLGH